MISFACLQCGMKFQVKDEFAGRTTTCPTCKQPIKVPEVSRTNAAIPAVSIAGSESSLDRAGAGATVTIGCQPNPDTPVGDLIGTSKPGAGRYVIDKEIARGGMGAVLRGIDRDIRREVAIKYMLDDQDEHKKKRFVEEAQITGQLEHPNIVPVHELGVDAQKRLFFTMKMVRGRSLAQVIDELRAHATDAEKTFPLSRLLTIFVNICHALAYAHSCNVIHRDLKPANIMVGEFGEVYVMDWGLAKVLQGERQVPDDADVATQYFASLTTQPSVHASGVSTTHHEDAEMLTQQGAILGTPAYMPPEQARADSHAIDERSDIYALGAILYAMLTLESPVEGGGGPVAVLMRVVEGEIKQPQERAPKRHVPAELSAIAMKALAKEPKNRYQTVEMLRRDVELYLAGRSVGAKHDSAREQVWKLIKRNKGVSSATAAALAVLTVVVAVAFQVSNSARVVAEEQRAKAEKAYEGQKEKEAAVRRSVPALVRAGRQLANENQIDQADEQVRLALQYDAKNLDAQLLKGQVLIARKQWPAARLELETYLRQRPRDAETVLLLEEITRGKPGDGPTLLNVIESLQRQKVPGLAAPLLPDLHKIVAAKAPLLPAYRQQIEARWKGLGEALALGQDGQFRLVLHGQNQVVDLAPLEGMRLDVVDVQGCRQIRDLSPLKGMPLVSVNLSGLPIDTLEPLRGMPLKSLNLQGCKQISDLRHLAGMKLTALNLQSCSQVNDLSPLQGMQLEVLDIGSCPLIRDLSPLRGQPLKTLNTNASTQISSLQPLQGMPLTVLSAHGHPLLKDITPLQGMPLTTLTLTWCAITDLDPLRNLPLTNLSIAACPVQDLTPLRDLPLTNLEIAGTNVVDLTPLEKMPLQRLSLTPNKMKKPGMEVVRKITSIQTIEVEAFGPYAPAEFWRRYDLGEFKK